MGGPLEIGGGGGGAWQFQKKNHAGPVHLEKKSCRTPKWEKNILQVKCTSIQKHTIQISMR